ncbi:malonyl-ACP O-methyltransferase BioC [Brevibacillus laterosporus]|uniref:malonyl-ACP O-methyltransferase BioC n=1 Tax=Brevibacillus laterosporus TaxID=1465 RepID=UPI00265668BB|nr:malonyl-ACP O-methyltransferase BioC [Brevibacillus laterosporus]MDN9009454.1 malonyl-ACP O-methyltransferase BioC [Brevibacillus laterosporus]MDO0940223.1 malonyl-ACP O-methyltransferase BioC [Brevibacillus laterosporus]
MPNKLHIQQRFNRKASSYDQHAIVQKQMADQLLQSLESEFSFCRALEIGCGTGYLTQKILTRPRSLQSYTALDLADKMLRQTEQAVRDNQPLMIPTAALRFICADIEEWAKTAPESSHDLILSNACFQWLHYPQKTLSFLHRILQPEGHLLFSTFGPLTFHELRDSYNATYANLGEKARRHILRFESCSTWTSFLKNAGFQNIKVRAYPITLYYSTVLDFLRSIKEIGATVSSPAHGLGDRRFLLPMMNYYKDTFQQDQGIPATYEIFLFTAQR